MLGVLGCTILPDPLFADRRLRWVRRAPVCRATRFFVRALPDFEKLLVTIADR